MRPGADARLADKSQAQAAGATAEGGFSISVRMCTIERSSSSRNREVNYELAPGQHFPSPRVYIMYAAL